MGIFRRLYDFFMGIGYTVGSVVLLAMRLYWGYLFFQAGWGKLGNIENVVTFFESLGIMSPYIMAHVVAYTETIGGLLLMAGFLSRLAAIPLAVTMIVAYCTAHYDALMQVFTDPKVFMGEEPFMYLLTALLVFSYGAGLFSIDAYLCRNKGSASEGE